MILDALRKKYEYEIMSAKANIDVYLKNSAGIGEHPDIVAAVDTEMEKLADAEDKLNSLNNNFKGSLKNSKYRSTVSSHVSLRLSSYLYLAYLDRWIYS